MRNVYVFSERNEDSARMALVQQQIDTGDAILFRLSTKWQKNSLYYQAGVMASPGNVVWTL